MRVLNKLIIGGLAVITLAALLFLSDKSIFKLQAIGISQFDDSVKNWMFQDIKNKIIQDTQAIIGKNMWEIDISELMIKVAKDQRVNKIQVQRKFPNQIEIKVLPHEPIAVFIDKKNRMIPLARDGTFLSEVKTFLDVPLLRGEALQADPKIKALALELLLSWYSKPFSNKQQISEIIYDSRQGFLVILMPDGEIIKLGTSDFAKRINMADQVFTYMQSKGLKGRVIDVRFSKKVVVSLRNAP